MVLPDLIGKDDVRPCTYIFGLGLHPGSGPGLRAA